MRISSIGGFVSIFWIVAEIIAYGLVIQKFGIAIAILIGVVSLGLGIFALRRLGLGMASLGEVDFANPEAMWTGLKRVGWAAFGAFLLIIPGYLTNSIGLFLLIMNPQAWIIPHRSVQTKNRDIIDLDPADWSAGSGDQRRHDEPSGPAHPPDNFR